MITLFHVSDVHFGAEDPDAITWFGERVAAERPDAVIMTGDLTMRATRGEFQRGGDWLRSLGVPVTLEVGNHDIPYYWDPFRRLFAPYQRYAAVEKMIERELDLPGVTIVPLKTTARAQWRWNWSKGRVSGGALRRALAMIAAAEGPADFRRGASPVDRGRDEGHGEDPSRGQCADRAGGGGRACRIVGPCPRSVRRAGRSRRTDRADDRCGDAVEAGAQFAARVQRDPHPRRQV